MANPRTAESVARLLLQGLGSSFQAKADQSRQLAQLALQKRQAETDTLRQLFQSTGDPNVGIQLQQMIGAGGQEPLKTPSSVALDDARRDLTENQTLASKFNLAATTGEFAQNIPEGPLRDDAVRRLQAGDFSVIGELVKAGQLPTEFERKFRDAEAFFEDHPEMLADETPEGRTEAILSFASGRGFLDAKRARTIIDSALIQTQVSQEQLNDLLANNRGELTFQQRFEFGQANMRNYLTATTAVEGVLAAKEKIARDQAELDELLADPAGAKKNIQRVLELKSNIQTESANVTLTDQGIANLSFYASEMERVIYNPINGAGNRLGATGGTLAFEDIDAVILNTTAGLNQRTQVIGVSAALGLEVPPEPGPPPAAPGFTTPAAPSPAVPGAPPTTTGLAAPPAGRPEAKVEKKKLSRLTTLATKLAAGTQALGFSPDERDEIIALAKELDISTEDVVFILKAEIDRIQAERAATRREAAAAGPAAPGGQFGGAAVQRPGPSQKALDLQKQLQGE